MKNHGYYRGSIILI